MADSTKILLCAYYERLHERLIASKDLLLSRIERLLRDEVANKNFSDFDKEKLAAYRDACHAFLDERMEAYNPIGIQYTFDHTRRREAAKLEFQLDWFDSSDEFKLLVESAAAEMEPEMTDKKLTAVVDKLIRQIGAFPDTSIITTYQAGPALSKLPDYVVARAIEEIIR